MISDIDGVRLKSSDRSTLTREEGIGDDESYIFKMGHNSLLSSPAPEVRIENVVQVGYTVDYTNGVITFLAPPAMNDLIEFTYYWSIFTDEQIQYFLDDSGGNVTVASAKVLLAIAADAAKIAQRQSLAGGGGLGAVTIDTSVASRELRAAAKGLLEMEAEISGNIPAEGLTEIYWTEMSYKLGVEQSVVRDS
jgi:hypothetical protein